MTTRHRPNPNHKARVEYAEKRVRSMPYEEQRWYSDDLWYEIFVRDDLPREDGRPSFRVVILSYDDAGMNGSYWKLEDALRVAGAISDFVPLAELRQLLASTAYRWEAY